ncbi:hypothetical protein DFP72DRAFT_1073995 [Ephemerocybe angulata]|uniref:Uncharacterized protein n=1 Tax=Ephemerocybe angulata TaxID=980116 RepID=A0A8H6LZG2_9AGAR|nr:hypothetical protein DFP72DRAFT_1073995 [Tulosesus angulatus]
MLPRDAQLEAAKHMDLQDLAALAHLWPDLAKEAIHLRLTSLLGSRHLDAEQFLEKMAETNSVVSGSGALEIILPGTCTPRDLDVYTPSNEGRTLVTYLEANNFESYKYEGTPIDRRKEEQEDDHEHYDNRNGIKAVHRLRHAVYGSQIHIIESVSLSPLVPLFFFHSTQVMNFVSATAAVCFYPELTFRRKGLMNFAWPGSDFKNLDAVQKYRARGFEIYDHCTKLHSHTGLCSIVDPYPRESCSTIHRRTDDAFVLKLPHFSTYAATTIRPGSLVITTG